MCQKGDFQDSATTTCSFPFMDDLKPQLGRECGAATPGVLSSHLLPPSSHSHPVQRSLEDHSFPFLPFSSPLSHRLSHLFILSPFSFPLLFSFSSLSSPLHSSSLCNSFSLSCPISHLFLPPPAPRNLGERAHQEYTNTGLEYFL